MDPSVSKKICDTIGELARHMLSKGGSWPELLPVLFQCSKSQVFSHRESSFRIWASVPALLTTNLDNPTIRKVLLDSLQDPVISVQLMGLRATSAYLQAADTAQRNFCSDLIPCMLMVRELVGRGGEKKKSELEGETMRKRGKERKGGRQKERWSSSSFSFRRSFLIVPCKITHRNLT